MCFSQPGSLGFGVVGLGTGLFLKSRGHPPRRYWLFMYFAIMEFIQFAAYFVVDQCDNPINKVLTMLAFIHVTMQNVMVNWFFLCPEFGVHPDVTKVICSMCATGGLMGIFMKLPWPVWLGAPVGLLDGLAKAVPEFFSLSTAGTPESCMYETMCAPQVCTFSTPNHIAWSVPVLPPSYYLPNSFLHFFFFFFPTLFMGNAAARLTMLLAFFTGPLLTQLLAAQHMATYKYEWPATWCYMSVGQCFVALAIEAYQIYKERCGRQQVACATTNGTCNGTAAPLTNGVNGHYSRRRTEDAAAHGTPDVGSKAWKKKA